MSTSPTLLPKQSLVRPTPQNANQQTAIGFTFDAGKGCYYRNGTHERYKKIFNQDDSASFEQIVRDASAPKIYDSSPDGTYTLRIAVPQSKPSSDSVHLSSQKEPKRAYSSLEEIQEEERREREAQRTAHLGSKSSRAATVTMPIKPERKVTFETDTQSGIREAEAVDRSGVRLQMLTSVGKGQGKPQQDAELLTAPPRLTSSTEAPRFGHPLPGLTGTVIRQNHDTTAQPSTRLVTPLPAPGSQVQTAPSQEAEFRNRPPVSLPGLGSGKQSAFTRPALSGMSARTEAQGRPLLFDIESVDDIPEPFPLEGTVLSADKTVRRVDERKPQVRPSSNGAPQTHLRAEDREDGSSVPSVEQKATILPSTTSATVPVAERSVKQSPVESQTATASLQKAHSKEVGATQKKNPQPSQQKPGGTDHETSGILGHIWSAITLPFRLMMRLGSWAMSFFSRSS